MKIGVNSRIFQNSKTGIPHFVKCLYTKLLDMDENYNYIFFQTDDSKKIGNTITVKTPDNILGTALFDQIAINRLIRSEKIDIFHGPANVLPFSRQQGIKYVVTIHDLSFLVFKVQFSKIFNIYYKQTVKRSLENADIIVADSYNTKNDIVKFFNTPGNKIHVIHLGIDCIYFAPHKKKRLIEDKYFFSITTHPKRKNTLCLLDIMSRNKRLKDHKYVIAGTIPDSQIHELKEKAKQLHLEDRIIIFGYATEDELVNLYQNAEFFIYPSFYEGFGLPVLDAMASRCPVITSNNSSLIEITPDKKWLVDPYDLDDISGKINEILNLSEQERYVLIKNNYNFSRKFTWEKTAEEYIKIFNTL